MTQPSKQTVLHDLISLSHHLGDEAREYIIIGEGNTSARIDAETFWIKASGQSLGAIGAEGFVAVDLEQLLAMLSGENAADDAVARGLMAARCDPDSTLRPSVEAILHAALYRLTDARFIGHTHPIAVNAVLCSQRAQDITLQLMPDVIVVCGAGFASSLAAASLRELGLTRAADLDGGFQSWRAAGLPVVAADA